MGLVSTWLNGIGLSNAVPTFQAAGIVTPSALAELDVAHFEALGVSNPDDRRKLFYLVQRIKMAVSKDKKVEQHSVEDQVDAVLSGTEVPVDVDDDDEDDEKKEERPMTAPRNRKTMEQEIEPSSSEEPRRSRRIAKSKNITNQETRSTSTSTSTRTTGSSKENRSLQTSPTKGRGSSTPSRVESPTRSSNQRKVDADRTASTHSPSKSTKPVQRRSVASKAQVQTRDETNTAGSDVVRPEGPPHRKNAGRSTSSDRANAVFNLHDESNEIVDSSAKITPKPSLSVRTSGLKKPGPASTPTTSLESETIAGENYIGSQLQTAQGKSETATRRTESRLPNPGKSMRTGKRLSVIPSEKVAPMSPLMSYEAGGLEGIEEADRTKKTSRMSDGHLRPSSGASHGSDSLEDLLQSSLSDLEADNDDESDQSSLSSANKSSSRRPKSMGLVRPNSRRLPSSQSDLTRPSSSRRKSEDLSRSLSASHSSDTVPKAATKQAPFVHGGTQAESWATQVNNLRDDNEAEHDLFRDQEDHQIYEYDMRIRVIIRKRPLSKAEANLSGSVDVVHPLDYGDFGRILVYQPKTRVDLTKEVESIPFAYDNVYDESSTNFQIYQRSLRNLVHPFFRGQWSTVFAYGQTGSGKTYTMMGSNMTGINAGTAKNDTGNYGLYYLAALDIFEMVKRPEYKHLTVQVSLFEIYGGKLFDLLNVRKQVKCLEDSKGIVCFPGLTEHPVSGPDDLMVLIEAGASNRSTGTTSRNADSSRSHAVLQLKLRKDVGRKKNVEHGRLNFIDLAGSERGADTSSSSRATRLEGAEINTSLLALKEVIRALATGGSMTHIPFRGSKLTQVLKDSFVGANSRCCMIACVSPDIGNCEQTLNTLRYADRVKERDSETGALANGYEQPVRLRPLELSADMKEDRESGDAHDLQSNSSDEDEEAQNRARAISDAAVLDNLLTTRFHEKPMTTEVQTQQGTTSSKLQAAEALTTSHRAVMSKMLSMVKDEMTLVNKVDADRDGLEDYLVQLESIQNSQLHLISELRGSLSNYVAACETPTGTKIATVEWDEESFEDLRD